MEVAIASRKKSLILLLAVSAVVVQAVAMRVRAHSTFRVEPPMRIGAWDIKSIPLSSEAMATLGNPQADGWSYSNALDESVTVQVISPDTFDAYRNPPILSRFFPLLLLLKNHLKPVGYNKQHLLPSQMLNRKS